MAFANQERVCPNPYNAQALGWWASAGNDSSTFIPLYVFSNAKYEAGTVSCTFTIKNKPNSKVTISKTMNIDTLIFINVKLEEKEKYKYSDNVVAERVMPWGFSKTGIYNCTSKNQAVEECPFNN